MHGNIPTVTPPNGGVECRWGKQNSRFLAYIWLQWMLLMLLPARCYQYDAFGPPSCKLWHFAGSKRQFVGAKGRRNVYDESFNITPKATEQHLIARSDKSVAYVTNNKRLYSTFCTIEANYWQTWSIAWPLCDSRASCSKKSDEMNRWLKCVVCQKLHT